MEFKITFFQLPHAVSQLDQKLTTIEQLLHERCKELKSNPLCVQFSQRETLQSISELAGFIGCSKSTANRIKKSGKIRFFQVNRKVLFFKSDILAAMSQGNPVESN